MKSRNILMVSAVIAQAAIAGLGYAEVRLPKIFGDNMVLQRGEAETLWGWSEPGDRIQVEFASARASGVAGPDRRWQVAIQPPSAGGPYTVKIAGRQIVELHNVMAGDVCLPVYNASNWAIMTQQSKRRTQ